eukprot:1379319-Amorphochlora_amoeboformis.AAC.1
MALWPALVMVCAGLQHAKLDHDQAHLSQTELKTTNLFDRYRHRMNRTARSRIRRFDTCPANPSSRMRKLTRILPLLVFGSDENCRGGVVGWRRVLVRHRDYPMRVQEEGNALI